MILIVVVCICLMLVILELSGTKRDQHFIFIEALRSFITNGWVVNNIIMDELFGLLFCRVVVSLLSLDPRSQ